MAAAGDLNPFGQQRLALSLKIGPGEGDIAMAIDHPMPGQGLTLPAGASVRHLPGARRAVNRPGGRHRRRWRHSLPVSTPRYARRVGGMCRADPCSALLTGKRQHKR